MRSVSNRNHYMKMITNTVVGAVVIFFSYVYAFWSLPFMGDEPAESSISMVLWSLVIIIGLDIFAYTRCKKLSRQWYAADGNKFILWSYQAVFLLLIAVSNILVGAVGWFYTLQTLA